MKRLFFFAFFLSCIQAFSIPTCQVSQEFELSGTKTLLGTATGFNKNAQVVVQTGERSYKIEVLENHHWAISYVPDTNKKTVVFCQESTGDLKTEAVLK